MDDADQVRSGKSNALKNVCGQDGWLIEGFLGCNE